MKTRLPILGAVTAWAAPVHAQAIFDNEPWRIGAPLPSEQVFSHGYHDGDPELFPLVFTGRSAAQSFTTGPSAITDAVLDVTLRLTPGIDFWPEYAVSVRLFTDDADRPSQPFFETTGLLPSGGGPANHVFRLGGEFGTVTLAADTRYWVVFESSTETTWHGSPNDTVELVRRADWNYKAFPATDTDDWQWSTLVDPGELSLRIVVVPEPGSLAFIGALGLGAWAVIRRRGRRAGRDPNRNSLAQPREAEPQGSMEL